MKFFDIFKMAIGNLTRRKSRTFLTVLGIVIGTISIVLMVALGIGMQESVNEQFADFASANIITVTKGDNTTSSTRNSEQEDNGNIQDIDIIFFESIEGVDIVAPILTSNLKFVSGKYEASIQVTGIDFDYLEALDYEIASTNPKGMESGILFGASTLDEFEEVEDSVSSNNKAESFSSLNSSMGGNRPAGMNGGMMPGMETDQEEEDEVYNVDVYTDRLLMTLDTSYSPQSGNGTSEAQIYPISGYGILEEGDMSRDRSVYMDIDELATLIKEYNDDLDQDTEEGYDSAYVYVNDMDLVESVQNYLEDYGYSASSSSDMLETMQSTIDTLQIALGAIGAVALLVAAIGITNTMIMAIHERKKEIGVMKVIGATIKDIKRLFLTEAALIGFLGGVIGISISVLLGHFLGSDSFGSIATGGRSPMGMMHISIPNWLIIIGMCFTTLVGVLSGYIPARQAMASSALEAIRTE